MKSLFQRRHYKFIAQCLRQSTQLDPKSHAAVASFMLALKQDNPKFSEERFMDAIKESK